MEQQESVCQEVFIPHEVDSRNVMSIRSSRRLQIPEHLRGADELHVCFELHHQKPNKVRWGGAAAEEEEETSS